MALSPLILVCLVFVLAGFTKGIIGLGLPTIAMGLLAVVLPPAEAAALLILPSLVTNVWQMLDGPHLGPLLRRLWPLNVGVCLGTWLGAALLAGIGGRHGGLALGMALLAYAASGLAALRLVVPRKAEPVLGPITGALTGGITAATGVFVIPAVPYLQAIGLQKDELVQALGLSFTVSTLALAVALAGVDAFAPGLVLPSLLAVVVSLAGMRLGQSVRARLRPQAFRVCFFLGLLALGAYLALRALTGPPDGRSAGQAVPFWNRLSTRSVSMTVHALKKSNVANLRAKVSPEEWQARVDLAAAYRLIDLYGMSDLIANHISMRVPGEPDAFLINAYGLLYEEITASSLIKIDHEGNVLAQPDFGDLKYGVNRAGFVIHSAIHMAKPEVNCIIHTHTWAGMAVSTMECGLLPNTQTSMRFAKISYHDFDGVVLDTAARAALAKDLGDNNALILRNHGLLTTGATIPEAFNAMHRLELSCKTQIAAMSCNTKLIQVPDDVVHETYMNFQPHVRRPFGVMDWPALLRKLDRIDPGFRD